MDIILINIQNEFYGLDALCTKYTQLSISELERKKAEEEKQKAEEENKQLQEEKKQLQEELVKKDLIIERLKKLMDLNPDLLSGDV